MPIFDVDLVARSRQVAFVWEETFLNGGLPYDFTGHDIRGQLRLYGGAAGAALLTLPLVGPGGGDGFRLFQSRPDAVLDGVRLLIGAPSLRDLPGLNTPEIGQPQRFAFDALLTVPNRLEEPFLSGTFTLFPGVTA